VSVYHPKPAPPRRRPWLIPLLVAVAVVVAVAGFALIRQGDGRSASADAPLTGASEPAPAEPKADESAADESASAEPVPFPAGFPASGGIPLAKAPVGTKLAKATTKVIIVFRMAALACGYGARDPYSEKG